MSTILSIIDLIIIRKVIIGIAIASIKTTMFSHFKQRKNIYCLKTISVFLNLFLGVIVLYPMLYNFLRP